MFIHQEPFHFALTKAAFPSSAWVSEQLRHVFSVITAFKNVNYFELQNRKKKLSARMTPAEKVIEKFCPQISTLC